MFSGTLTYFTFFGQRIGREWPRYPVTTATIRDPSSIPAKNYLEQQKKAKKEVFAAVSAATTAPSLSLRDLPIDKLLHHVRHYKRQITDQLRSAVSETGKTVLENRIENLYHVLYPLQISTNIVDRDKDDLLCQVVNIKASTFLRGNSFFENQQLGSYLPSRPLRLMDNQRIQRKPYPSCAVVSSAGSLLDSNLGRQIDSNDFVIRFNNAPTLGFEKDVGNKTSLRIVNSQVVGKPKFGFLSDDKQKGRLYGGDGTPILVWDPASYNSSLADWLRRSLTVDLFSIWKARSP